MTPDKTLITSEAELNAAIKQLLRSAHSNSVSVSGGWECLTDDQQPNWDVVVTEVTKPEQST